MHQEERTAATGHSRRVARCAVIGPWLKTNSPVMRYGVAALAVLVTTLLRAALNPLLGTTTPLLPLLPAVLLTALAVGRGPAFFACVFAPALLIHFLSLGGEQIDWIPWLAHSTFFVVIGAPTVAIIHALQRAHIEQSGLLEEANASERRALANELHLQVIADSMPVLISYLDRDHRYQFVNGHYERWFGIPRGDIVGRHARDVLGEAAYATVKPHMDDALRGASVVFETLVPYARGDQRFVRARYVPRRSLDGAVLGFFALIDDLTERRRAEQELVELQQHLSMALRAGRSGTFEWDIGSDKNTWSDELLELYGFRRGEFSETHEGWLACIVAEDRAQIAASAENALKVGSNRIEFRIRRHDTGELRWIHARAKVFYDSDGKPVRMVGANTDITEHKLAAETLADRERTLQLIYDNSSDGIALLQVGESRELRVVSVNATLLRSAGLGREQVEGLPLEQVVPQPHWPFVLTKCREAMETGDRVSFEKDMELPAGRRHAEISLIPVASTTGLHILVCVTDVTSEKAMEAAQRAEAQRKDEFIAMLAHELRNPLVPIRNVAHLLTKEQFSPAKSQELGLVIERQTKHLTRLVDDLLDVSRITRSALELHRERVPLEDVIRQAIEMLESALNGKRQTFSIQWLAPGNLVTGDRARLVQVFANLLSNASKYSPEGAVIELRVEQEDGSVVVRVIDHGEGIDASMLGKVFDLFEQADKSLDRRNSGLGVGLTIAKRLVELHGGRIEARSAGLGQGSEFLVRLPVAEPADRGEPTTPSADAALQPAATRAPARVLIVDDNAAVAVTLGMMLEIEGFDVRMVHDGRSALQELESYEAEVILLDIGLPDIDGYMVAQSVRERYAHRAVLIIAVTGYGTPADRELALKSGFDAHLTKPVEPDVLVRTIREGFAPGATTELKTSSA
jgi:PAS domain S-box-containing protein